MTWDDVLAIGLKLLHIEAATSYGTPALKVRGKLMTRLRAEDDSLVLHSVPPDEREILFAADPRVFHITTHYEGYPAVLGRLAALETVSLWPFLVRRWREVAPDRAVASFDAAQAKS
ncbi:MmcQ/YjbR family DNA-binding protein [Methylobacterium sp. WL30]|uniref:MmcQ/YjbR family DNA-binding protein n=1 Tax=unclassified Methylobacterium TaxID=2615210 RepID=UPI0011CCC441|nr:MULTISPECIES: MmcQ/YjbR family DNA-binding protein [unclassified Methylobacterium]TXN40606.1 MmcQ/YjbR family DNA-binding protein [Methylobacterium sp. WL93]TXN51544.1 MmcQ/YjbR family DNA-binding protein [Methylobacterium sp. WL119]TXN63548.1 MmcQ/YjbR family DNA-binding protein [Methylobacterium sp. WL30]